MLGSAEKPRNPKPRPGQRLHLDVVYLLHARPCENSEAMSCDPNAGFLGLSEVGGDLYALTAHAPLRLEEDSLGEPGDHGAF